MGPVYPAREDRSRHRRPAPGGVTSSLRPAAAMSGSSA